MRSIIFLLFLCFIARSQAQSLSSLVNPLVGTDAHGHTFPGASMPFGMVQLSPDTRNDDSWDGCSGYHYSDKQIWGFSHTHLSGTGCSDYGDIILMPSDRNFGNASKMYRSGFNHQNEKASPGYYEVYLDKPKVKASFTVTERCGLHRYAFSKADSQFIFLDLQHRDEVLDSEFEIWNETTIRGYRYSKAWAKDQKIFFEIQFSKPFIQVDTYRNDTFTKKPYAKSKNVKVLFHFSSSDASPLYVKVGISAVSAAGAANNLKKELPAWDFDKTKNEAERKWDKELSKIKINDVQKKAEQKVFYTNLYHCLLAPNIYNDVDGKYRGRDNKIYSTEQKFNYYTVFSLWDTYRALHPLLTIIDPKRANDFVRTFLEQYKQVGKLPVWELSANETDCMIGYHAASVIWDAYQKGIRNYDAELAFKAMKDFAMGDERGLASYKKYGFVRSDDEAESVSKTLEYAYDDWCIAQMAKALGKEEEYQYFMRRSKSYKNIFDAGTGFMRPVLNSTWLMDFSPYRVDNNFTEANSWQYSFYAPHDITGLVQLHGGAKNFEKKLDDLFSANTSTEGREQADITGLIGQYAHGNEPSHHIAYLYNYCGAFQKSNALVHKILDSFYTIKPDGLIGNEDCGQMSAWYVMAAMGLYPVCPGSGVYDLSEPFFNTIELHCADSAKVLLTANSYKALSAENGLKYTPQLAHTDLLRFGNDHKHFAPFLPYKDKDHHQFVCNPVIASCNQIFKDKNPIAFTCNEEQARIYFSLNRAPFVQYQTPFELPENASLQFYTQKDSMKSPVQEAYFYKLPDDLAIQIKSKYTKSYSGGGDMALLDGLHGTTSWQAGKWQGYQGQDFEATIELKKPRNISSINLSFLQDQRSWIFFPTQVSIFISDDGKSFKPLSTQKIAVPRDDEKNSIKSLQFEAPQLKAKFIKVLAKNYGKLPEWHPGAGYDSYIFIDEIELK